MNSLKIKNSSLFLFGEMSELAEGARLEIVCAVKSGTEGSNPSLSAILKSGMPGRKLGFFVKIKEGENFNRRNTGSISRIKI
jgi:hypothetical protein